jgi:predicted transcriptional regulator
MAGNPAVVVARDGRPAGIVTRSDLMAFYGRTRRAKG